MAKKKYQINPKALQRSIFLNMYGIKTSRKRDIETCKAEIESWYEYEEETVNPCIIMGLEHDDAIEKLEKLKSLRPKRELFYKPFQQNESILNLICDYPDVMNIKQKDKRRLSNRLILERDLYKTRLKLYKNARAKIKDYVKKQNEKLVERDLFFKFHPIDITINSTIEDIPLDQYQLTLLDKKSEIGFFLKELSVILFPSLPNNIERTNRICDILQIFYGINEYLADPDNIKYYIKDNIY